MNEIPSVNPQPATAEVAPAFKVLRLLVGFLQLVSMAMVIAPSLATLASRQFGFEGSVPEAPVRAAGVGLFFATGIVRFLLPGGRRRYRSERSFAELAGSTGGTFSVEPRRLGKSGWSGGPTARWTLQGVPVTLECFSQSSNSGSTRIASHFPASKALRFIVLPRNVLTRFLTAPKFVGMIQTAIPKPNGTVTEAKRAETVKEIGVLAGAEVKLGDSMLDDKILVKSDDGDLTRYVLCGSGVSERMAELNTKRRSWTLSLYTAEGGADTQLTLDLPGVETDPAVLQSAKDLVEGVLGSLRQNGVLARAA